MRNTISAIKTRANDLVNFFTHLNNRPIVYKEEREAFISAIGKLKEQIEKLEIFQSNASKKQKRKKKKVVTVKDIATTAVSWYEALLMKCDRMKGRKIIVSEEAIQGVRSELQEAANACNKDLEQLQTQQRKLLGELVSSVSQNQKKSYEIALDDITIQTIAIKTLLQDIQLEIRRIDDALNDEKIDSVDEKATVIDALSKILPLSRYTTIESKKVSYLFGNDKPDRYTKHPEFPQKFDFRKQNTIFIGNGTLNLLRVCLDLGGGQGYLLIIDNNKTVIEFWEFIINTVKACPDRDSFERQGLQNILDPKRFAEQPFDLEKNLAALKDVFLNHPDLTYEEIRELLSERTLPILQDWSNSTLLRLKPIFDHFQLTPVFIASNTYEFASWLEKDTRCADKIFKRIIQLGSALVICTVTPRLRIASGDHPAPKIVVLFDKIEDYSLEQVKAILSIAQKKKPLSIFKAAELFKEITETNSSELLTKKQWNDQANLTISTPVWGSSISQSAIISAQESRTAAIRDKAQERVEEIRGLLEEILIEESNSSTDKIKACLVKTGVLKELLSQLPVCDEQSKSDDDSNSDGSLLNLPHQNKHRLFPPETDAALRQVIVTPTSRPRSK